MISDASNYSASSTRDVLGLCLAPLAATGSKLVGSGHMSAIGWREWTSGSSRQLAKKTFAGLSKPRWLRVRRERIPWLHVLGSQADAVPRMTVGSTQISSWLAACLTIESYAEDDPRKLRDRCFTGDALAYRHDPLSDRE